MHQGRKAIVWFNEVTKKDIPLVGGKGANLGEMTNAGIPALEVIMIATYNGAKALNISDEVGSIEVGKQADLVILNSNPVENIKNTRKIEYILKNGKLYKPSELLSKKNN